MSVYVYPILLSFICCPLKSVPSSTLIGYFTETEPISYSGRVFIDRDDIDNISLVKHVDCEVNLSGSSPTYRYYYNTTKEEGKILKIRQIRNDVDSFIYVLDQRQSASYITNRNVFAYRRTFNKNYSSKDIKWQLVTTDVDESLCRTLDEDKSHNLMYPHYFCNFLKADDVNNVNHKNCFKYDSAVKLIDPENSDNSIDRIHRAAVRNGVYQHDSTLFSNETTHALVSWAGDLQSQTKDLKNESIDSSFITEETLFDPDKKFSFDDLSADIDGFNIAYFLGQNEKIADKMKSYYNRRERDSQYRYTLFRSSTVMDYYNKPEDGFVKLSEYFEKRIYDRLALTLDDSGKVTDKGGFHPIRYEILGGKDRPSMEIRKKAAKVFARYILRKADREERIPLYD